MQLSGFNKNRAKKITSVYFLLLKREILRKLRPKQLAIVVHKQLGHNYDPMVDDLPLTITRSLENEG